MTFKRDSSSTSQDSDFANLKLYLNGSEVGSGALVNKYVTFTLNTTILKNKSDQKFEIRGDIVGGASKTVKFVIDSTTDITANGSQYLYGANTSGTASAPATTVNITAGAVSLVREDAVLDKVIANKKDVVFGKIKVTANSGKDVELSTLKLTIDSTNDQPAGVAHSGGAAVGDAGDRHPGVASVDRPGDAGARVRAAAAAGVPLPDARAGDAEVGEPGHPVAGDVPGGLPQARDCVRRGRRGAGRGAG